MLITPSIKAHQLDTNQLRHQLGTNHSWKWWASKISLLLVVSKAVNIQNFVDILSKNYDTFILCFHVMGFELSQGMIVPYYFIWFGLTRLLRMSSFNSNNLLDYNHRLLIQEYFLFINMLLMTNVCFKMIHEFSMWII